MQKRHVQALDLGPGFSDFGSGSMPSHVLGVGLGVW